MWIYLLVIKGGKNRNIAVKESGRHHFNQVIKVSITGNMTFQVPTFMGH